MRILISAFIILALVILCPGIGTLIMLVPVGVLMLFPVALAILACVLIFLPLVTLIEMMILKIERAFVRACDAVFHRPEAFAH